MPRASSAVFNAIAVASAVLAGVALTVTLSTSHSAPSSSATLVVPLRTTPENGTALLAAFRFGSSEAQPAIVLNGGAAYDMLFQRTGTTATMTLRRNGRVSQGDNVAFTLTAPASVLVVFPPPAVATFLSPCAGVGFGNRLVLVPTNGFFSATTVGLVQYVPDGNVLGFWADVFASGSAFASLWPTGLNAIPLFSLAYAAPPPSSPPCPATTLSLADRANLLRRGQAP